MVVSHHRFTSTPSGCDRHMYKWIGAFKKQTEDKKTLTVIICSVFSPGAEAENQ